MFPSLMMMSISSSNFNNGVIDFIFRFNSVTLYSFYKCPIAHQKLLTLRYRSMTNPQPQHFHSHKTLDHLPAPNKNLGSQ